MPRYVALFRGINVGNAKRIAMADLRKILESLGYENVATLLNSGNAIFDAKAEPEAKHAQRIHDAVLKKLKVDALVVVKSAADVAGMIAGNKFGKIATNPSLLLVAMTNDAKGWKVLETIAGASETAKAVHLGKHALYAWCPEGTLKSRAGVALLTKLADSGTTRNWTTLEKIHEMLREIR
ncbi:MAG TPA: DUF1697 domain-containing protein [Usitatibacter sp.]|nr:DUF1697 domain-containing protein [Usitatibacter sp.]